MKNNKSKLISFLSPLLAISFSINSQSIFLEKTNNKYIDIKSLIKSNQYSTSTIISSSFLAQILFRRFIMPINTSKALVHLQSSYNTWPYIENITKKFISKKYRKKIDEKIKNIMQNKKRQNLRNPNNKAITSH
jgi:hypothetical protein